MAKNMYQKREERKNKPEKIDDKKTNINWYPGHMAKATREIKEKIKAVDIVIELADSRAPISSTNPVVKQIIENKKFLKVFTKADLADDKKTKKWEEYFKSQDIDAVFVDLNKKESVGKIITKMKELTSYIAQKDIKRGLKPRAVRAIVLGIPNVGKSTFINAVAKKKSASVANKPGHTKSQQWVHCDGFELLDTPGILWPNISENGIGVKLALIGCIKQEILPNSELIVIACDFLSSSYSGMLEDKYSIKYNNYVDFIEDFSKLRGHLLKDNVSDDMRSINVILNDFKNGYLGKITLETVEDIYGKL